MTEANDTTDTSVQDNTNATPPGDETQDAPDTGLMGDEVKPDETKDTGLMGDEEAEGDKTPEAGEWQEYGSFEVEKGFELKDDALTAVEEIGKKHNISKETMQDLLDFNIKSQKEQTEAGKIAEAEADKAQVVEWQAEARKEHGDKYSEVLANSKKVWDSVIMPAELKTLMKATDLRYNPHVLNLFNNISKHISEDAFVQPEQKTKGKNEGGINDMFSDLKKT